MSVYAPEWPNTVSQSVNLLSKLACALGQGESAVDAVLAPITTDRKMEPRVSVGNAAVLLLDTQQAAVTLLVIYHRAEVKQH